jgi:tetratricopeptide (TPR) repeat protein
MRITELWSDALRLYNEGKYEDTCDKYTELVKIKPDDHMAYNNWGNALGDWAKLKGDEKLFEQACQKYEQAIKIKPDMHEAYNNWGDTFTDWAQLKIGTPEYEVLLKQAEGKCLKAESLKKGAGAYNLACVYALRGDKEQCRKWLLVGQETGTLPTRSEAMKDSDLDIVKGEPWFKEIKWKGE